MSEPGNVDRRRFLRMAGGAAVAATAARLTGLPFGALPRADAADPVCAYPPPFDPDAWMRARHQGAYTTKTPQAGLPLIGVRAETLTAWKSERAKYLAAWREIVGPWPARPPLQAAVVSDTDVGPYRRLKVSYQSLAGDPYASTITAWLLIPNGPVRPRPAIVCLHQTIAQGKDEPAGINASLPWYTFADEYARLGFVTLAPDAIGYGERTNGCNAATGFELSDAWSILRNQPKMTLLGLMLFDVTRAFDYLATRLEVDANRIGLMGHSQGGILTNAVLPLEPRCRVGVASCGYGIFRQDAYFDRWAGTNSAYVPRLYRYRANRNAIPIDWLHVLALAAPTPHLVQTAMADTIWSPPAVASDPFVARELARVHRFYGATAGSGFVSMEEQGDHGWYPDAQARARQLFVDVLRP